MGKPKRLDIFRDNHIGFGIRWDDWDYALRLSFAFPFFSITIGLGKQEDDELVEPFETAEELVFTDLDAGGE